MARSKKQIKAEITTPFMANETLAAKYGFAVGASFDAEFSLVTLENILFEIVALALFIHEQFFDQHTIEVNERLANEKAGTLPWYRTMALRFQYGFDLLPDTDVFDNGDATAEQIEASKIIKYAAVNEAQDSSRVILKIAGETDGVLTDFDNPLQVEAIEAYINEIRVAGVPVTIINYKADKLYLNLRIKRDRLVLNESGMSKLDANYPVNEALQEFMKELDFNGELKLSALVDKLQVIPGVLDATVISASSAWIDPALDGYGVPQPIFVSKIAESGYFEIVTFDNIEYVA
ncbi:hypothetical protein GCM10008015_26920 [Flavobacterium palustre]|uniref:Nucleotidyltransferase n=1 Tax=Flavobacterium palustre TaxID=1476463 RepID=A0ABQ1HNX4_9FLAO|nr:nucleotidyltransferase [Flavobacterium palustre]GGA84754.1 hypothetical protein GCM10008015_26920 [Flavobacterium palustre]